jgi:hypothetical protein
VGIVGNTFNSCKEVSSVDVAAIYPQFDEEGLRWLPGEGFTDC